MADVKQVTAAEYEQAVMDAAARGEPAPSDVEPPEDYEMSADFQAWLVDAMRKEVMDQVSGQGLDRMAILRSKEQEEQE